MAEGQGFMGSVMDRIFGQRAQNTDPMLLQKQVQQITNNLANNPAPQQTQQTQQTAANGVIPDGGATPPAPMEKFAKVWEAPTIDPNKQSQGSQPLDPKKLADAAQKVNFANNFDAAEIAKVLAGGDGAAEALAGLLNKASSAAYTQATVVSTQIADHTAKNKSEQFNSAIPALVKSQQFETSLLAKLPVLKNPAIAPLVADVQAQLVQKFPEASVQELTDMGVQYFQEMASQINPSSAGSSASQSTQVAQKEEDWDKYLSS